MESIKLTVHINVRVSYRMYDGLDGGESCDPSMKHIKRPKVPPSEPEKHIVSAGEDP